MAGGALKRVDSACGSHRVWLKKERASINQAISYLFVAPAVWRGFSQKGHAAWLLAVPWQAGGWTEKT